MTTSKNLTRVAVVIAAAALALSALAGCSCSTSSSSSSNVNGATSSSATVNDNAERTSSNAASEGASEDARTVEDGQNPVMNFIGTYADGRASILVECDGTDGAKFEVIWSDSAKENDRWEMSGKFNEDTLRVEYDNATRSHRIYDDAGNLVKEETIYSDGQGVITLDDENPLQLKWEDAVDHIADGMTFEYVSSRS